jgi:hypothetical protein
LKAPIESPESSSPIVTRAVASGLRGEYSDIYDFPEWQKLSLVALGALPHAFARFIISRFETITGLDPRTMDNFSLDKLLRTRLGDYANNEGHYPVILAGAALGGATAYLSIAMGGPFLPQAFVVSLKHGAFYGDVNEYLHRSLDTALRIADENPELMTIQHYDPVHDGWMTRFINHLRFKLLDLPPTYAEFIRSNLEPGGAIVYLESGASWLRYRLGPRSIFQVGGWGGLSPEEFIYGSERIRDYARRSGLRFSDWSLKDYSLERGPESEWGSEPGFAEALDSFCQSEGYRFIRINLPHPHQFSRLAYSSAELLLKKEGRLPAGILIEMFTQFDANAARQAGLLPIWLIYNTLDSLEFLKEMQIHFPVDKPIFFSPLATFSMTPDLVPWDNWESLLGDFQWINIGSRPSHYPADARALVKWADPLRKWVKENHIPLQTHLSPEEVSNLANQIQTN